MSTKKNTILSWIGTNVGVILTALTTVLVTYLTIQGSHNEKKEDIGQQTKKQRHDDSLFTMEYNFKKAQLIQLFMPFIISKDSVTVKLALLSFWTMDTTFAINTANTINTVGSKNALYTIFLLKSKQAIKPNTQHLNAKQTSPGTLALSNALTELSKVKLPNSQVSDFSSKYLNAVGASDGSQWSVAFIIWCFKSDKNLISNLKTIDIKEFYIRLKQMNLLLNSSENPQSGDIVFFNFQENNGAEQCGIISNIDKNYIYTIEADNNGEAVSSHIRYKADAMTYARIH